MDSSETKYPVKRYLIILTIFTVVIMAGIGVFSYIVDPFFQYRVKSDSKYFLNPRFVNGGLAKNYDYNVAVIGSSMTQNYNLSIIRKNDKDAKPVKLSTGGMNQHEMEYLYFFVKKEQTKELIINLDIIQFNSTDEAIRYHKYLYDDGIINKLEYLYNYETVVRYAPIDIGLTLYLGKDGNLTSKYRTKTSIDDIGNTSLETNYGKQYVQDLYKRGITVSAQNKDGMEQRMQQRLDSMLVRFDIGRYENTEYIFVLPPYSALYWYHTQKLEYYNQLIDFVSCLRNRLSAHDNVRILCFFDMEEITDLNYYADITHFSPALSDKILENLHNPHYELTQDNIDIKLQRLDSLVSAFKESNKDWI